MVKLVFCLTRLDLPTRAVAGTLSGASARPARVHTP